MHLHAIKDHASMRQVSPRLSFTTAWAAFVTAAITFGDHLAPEVLFAQCIGIAIYIQNIDMNCSCKCFILKTWFTADVTLRLCVYGCYVRSFV